MMMMMIIIIIIIIIMAGCFAFVRMHPVDGISEYVTTNSLLFCT
jgi:uncharacterized protein YxeA